MASAAQRSSPRVDVTLDVTLQTVDGDVPCETRDASYQGVFIVRRDPLPLRKLIRFRARLPDSDEQLQMLGLVAHTVNASEAAEQNRDPGMGIQLFSLGSQTRQRWRDFIDELYYDDPGARLTLESSRRPDVQMRIPDDEALQRFRTVDLANNEVFVRTPDLHPLDTQVDCVINHPNGESFTLTGTVTDVVDTSVTDRGLELELDLPEDRSRLETFLGASIPDQPADLSSGEESSEPPPSPDEMPPNPHEETQQ